jgi:hypothetical protein
VLNKRDKQHLEAVQMRFLRPLLVYSKLDLERNVDIRQRLKVQNTVEEIQTYQWNSTEHVERWHDNRLPNLAVKTNQKDNKVKSKAVPLHAMKALGGEDV